MEPGGKNNGVMIMTAFAMTAGVIGKIQMFVNKDCTSYMICETLDRIQRVQSCCPWVFFPAILRIVPAQQGRSHPT